MNSALIRQNTVKDKQNENKLKSLKDTRPISPYNECFDTTNSFCFVDFELTRIYHSCSVLKKYTSTITGQCPFRKKENLRQQKTTAFDKVVVCVCVWGGGKDFRVKILYSDIEKIFMVNLRLKSEFHLLSTKRKQTHTYKILLNGLLLGTKWTSDFFCIVIVQINDYIKNSKC